MRLVSAVKCAAVLRPAAPVVSKIEFNQIVLSGKLPWQNSVYSICRYGGAGDCKLICRDAIKVFVQHANLPTSLPGFRCRGARASERARAVRRRLWRAGMSFAPGHSQSKCD